MFSYFLKNKYLWKHMNGYHAFLIKIMMLHQYRKIKTPRHFPSAVRAQHALGWEEA